jgi:hypothetical protein
MIAGSFFRPQRGEGGGFHAMSESTAISEIEERLQDLVVALRQAGRPDLGRMLERHHHDFTSVALVRRSVSEIQRQLQRWREPGSELPDTPKVQFAANRLEDACNEALGAGVIGAARPSIGAQARRKLGIVLVTLLGAAVVLLIAIALVSSGVELDQLGKEIYTDKAELARGSEIEVRITARADALIPEATKVATFEPLPGCRRPHGPDASCVEVQPRDWNGKSVKTWELKLPNRAYGLYFAIVSTELVAGKVGVAQLLIWATDETPEGSYEIPLRAAYSGYTPLRCEALDRLMKSCPPPRVGAEERHSGVPVSPLVVRVLPPDPALAAANAQAAADHAAETQRKAAERTAEIESALTEIQAEVKETEALAKRRKWQEARVRLAKLGELFAPLDAPALAGEAPGVLPPEVGKVRARYEVLHEKLQAFEAEVFEATFTDVTAVSNKAVAEDKLLERIGKRFKVSPDYVESIYTDRTEEIQRRLEARARAHLDKVKAEQQAREQRCGVLPTATYKATEAYLKEALAAPRVEIALGECLTPRLTEKACWEMQCDYQRKEEVAVERPKVVTKHRVIVHLVHGRITGHKLL